ncbi:hypothetical protein M5D96_006099 [Drosophila gunungcola]|uniref:Chitin-binding type-2 domain-containing protein n=1 Tax=Drosophila gunungcola TaxID=103775 RepID=A0A9P9YRH7_9MUSC|nr:hypothetical protein M5D96_006099 [Drosophila gunungcola]
MKMQLIILVLAILSCGLAVEVTLNCEKCLASTDVYCINQTSYRNCISKSRTDLNLKASCSNSEYTTTTTEAPTTVTPSSEQKKSACSAAATDLNIPATTKYFFTKYNADTTCRSYLYCERSGTTDWSIVYMTCTSSKPFYDSAKSVCVATKPSTCA